MGKKIQISENDAKRIVKECYSIADFCRKVGWQPRGDNYKIFHIYEKEYGLDTSHFTGLRSNIGNVNNVIREKTVDEYIKGHYIKSSVLLKKLVKENIKERRCECCGNTHWEGKPIPLELHHIDGDHFNNSIDNLQVMCLNCHYFTDNYKGKKNKVKKEYKCSICGSPITKWSKSGICADCSHKKQRKVERPTKEELEKLMETNSISGVGQMFGVSFPTVKKWMKYYNIQR